MRPTRVRLQVLAMLFLFSIITYLDRLCIGVVAPQMSEELGISPSQLGLVFSIFTLSYGLFEIPSGWLGDRFGPRAVITHIVTWWSALTALTGVVRSYTVLLLVRFSFGALEAGAYPNASGVIRRWFPATERGRAQGVVWAAASVGGALGPYLIAPILTHLGWRAVFYVFASFGVIWALFWYRWFRNNPAEMPRVNEAEIAHIGPTSALEHHADFGRMFRSGNLWLIMTMYHIRCYGTYWFIFWMPSYLVEWKGLVDFAPYVAVPFVLGAIGNYAGGHTTDALVAKLGLKTGRRAVGVGAGLVSAVCVLLATGIENLVLAVGMLAIAYAAIQFALPNDWALCLDVGRDHVGAVSGAMNTAGQIGGTVALTAIGYAIEAWGWDAPLYGVAGVYLVGSLFWAVIDPTKPVAGDDPAVEAA